LELNDDEEDSKRSHGHAEGVKARNTLSHDEAWMVNIGRHDNDAWLLGPRDEDEWFTGLKPSICPGKFNNRSSEIKSKPARLNVKFSLAAGADSKGVIRSLPLPNLDAVTRQSAKEYFDNSWSLYETLFAGLKGEEGFYR
jgi:hypothetical protein